MRRIALIWVVGSLVALGACGKKDGDAPKPKQEPQAEEPKAEEPKAEEPKAGPPEDTVSVFVAHEVEDFDKWKQAFDSHADARKAASVMFHSVSRDLDNDNMVYIHLVGTDLAKLQEFAGSEDLKNVMKEAGVKGPPEIAFANDVQIDSPKQGAEGETYSVIVRHEVEDFDAWKPKFDADAPRRAEGMGVMGGSVSRAADNENMVIMHFMVSDPEKVAAALASEDLKKLMQEAGVKGEPELTVGKDVEISAYR